ncbi:type II/IV secretion system ATPase subunit [Candidatus Woesearchaeota archaeon]|nr:type II/IV secretion system ATPase subunit [Candidatus Woesearchaeota archaeon]
MAEKKTDSKAEEETKFEIDLNPKLITIPDFKNKTEVNIQYPLMEPYAYAQIYWDETSKELIYEVLEPVLDDDEQNILKLVQLGLEEMINISFAHASKLNILIEYLERNVQSILVEIGASITQETYNKIMYYVYRDSVGLNLIEPLIHDYFIEDIECNGINTPIYVVHRKFENIKTKIIYNELETLTSFVEKLAQKTGRYVSYAKPLLDGTLPDGSRVNATYTSDITTRGPTFTIRKFTKDPWSPTHLISFNTASADVFAYLWLAIEYKFNVMIIGETASGKTTFLNTIVQFIPPEARICSIEDTRELNLAHDNWLPAVTRTGFGIPNQDGEIYGGVTLFDLLRETFRQNPDYVIVGEIRGKEAYVLFQGMASGHPSFGTFHAGSVNTLVRRLETHPINLPSSLVESLDIVCVTTHVKTKDKNYRRIKEVNEIKKIEGSGGEIEHTTVFEWDPIKDETPKKEQSIVVEKISKRTGIPVEHLEQEMSNRSLLLQKLADDKIYGYRELNEIISEYYQKPKDLLVRIGIIK